MRDHKPKQVFILCACYFCLIVTNICKRCHISVKITTMKFLKNLLVGVALIHVARHCKAKSHFRQLFSKVTKCIMEPHYCKFLFYSGLPTQAYFNAKFHTELIKYILVASIFFSTHLLGPLLPHYSVLLHVCAELITYIQILYTINLSHSASNISIIT